MMDERERRDIMLRAIHRYGEAAQIDMAVEEIADVQIMLDQLRLIFARSTDEVEEEKLRRLLGRLNSYAESNLHKWLNGQYEPGIWIRTVDAGAQPREGGATDE